MKDDRDSTELVPGQVRDPKKNDPTRYGVRLPVPLPAVRYRDLFVAHYDAVARACRPIDTPGLAIVAIDYRRGTVAGILSLPARPDRAAAAIVGRHSCADLSLPDADERLALRHVAVLLEPARSFQKGRVEVSYRVLDLRTTSSFQDEAGNDLASVRAEGPAFFRCGSYALMFLTVGDPSDWPDDAAQAWSFLPERIHFDERPGQPRRRRPEVPAGPRGKRQTFITHVPPPRPLGDLNTDGEPAVATIELSVLECVDARRLTLAVGARALRDGILLGRYDRCNAAGLFDGDDTISRVHLLLVSLGEQVVAIDTGSTVGTFLDDRDIGVLTRLHDDTELVLGASTQLRWRSPPHT